MAEYKKKKIIALITARGNSKRIKNKNLQDVNGKPLIAYSIEHGLKSPCISAVYISSEDPEILRVGESFGAKPLVRPSKLSLDTTLHPAVISYCAKQLNYDFDLLVLLQPTSPLRKLSTIKCAVDNFISNWYNFDSALPVYLFKEKIGFIKNGCYVSSYGTAIRSQDIKDLYRECGVLFIFKKKFLLGDSQIYGQRIMPILIDDFWESIDIDTPDQLELVKVGMRYKNEKS